MDYLNTLEYVMAIQPNIQQSANKVSLVFGTSQIVLLM